MILLLAFGGFKGIFDENLCILFHLMLIQIYTRDKNSELGVTKSIE